ncbi:hypothetical protein MPPM_3901 [Methylorubrum populi]|uniref:Uncharacterized protein n=1 Tax=Methylorubrum populi TaxID=223967 RepID=A0A160PHZ2_9HYPH|nr:hypothetical protein [Methylorubrum populi]BAU92506.1 hypothetical protein MPPM_3901 [Methylorubrum populi]
MIALAQDFLAAGVAVALYALGIRLFLGRCQRLAPPTQTLPSSSNDNRHAMPSQRPAAEPLDINAISVAVGMAVLLLGSGVSLVACLRINGWL